MAIFRAIGQSRCTTIKISIAGGATIPRQSSHPLVRWEEQWVPQDVFPGKTFLSKDFFPAVSGFGSIVRLYPWRDSPACDHFPWRRTVSEHLGRIRSARVRLVGSGSSEPAATGRRLYRPLIVGAAILHRTTGGWLRSQRGIPRGSWRVDVLAGRALVPDVPRRPVDIERVVAWRQQRGETCRVAAALVSCCDVTTLPPLSGGDEPSRNHSADAPTSSCQTFDDRPNVQRSPGVVEIYGWALMYQLPGMLDAAAIDPHEEFDDLPAYYNSPLELVDRAAFLAARGIPNRPIALLTRREDFHPRGAGQRPINRFQPEVSFRRPADLRRIFA